MSFFTRMFGKKKDSGQKKLLRIFITNTLSNEKELFIPVKPNIVSMYTCGPTVYSKQHIGNLRPGVFSDVLARTFVYAGYRVRRVINITDVGHMVGDGDSGEDKVGANPLLALTTKTK